MPDKHARLSCSAADRWIHCPASVHLSEEYGPKDTGSIYSEEGTEAHSLAEWKLHKNLLKDTRKRAPKGKMYDAEMDEATDYYLEQVKTILDDCGPGAQLMVEQEFHLDPYIPEGFGTSDAVIISDGALHVIDFKYGKGVQVDAENNPQLRCYALGTLMLFEDLYQFDLVITHIIQPRIQHESSEIITADALKKWGREVLQPAAQKAWDNSEETQTGPWCQFCPIRAICRAREEDALQAARSDFKDPATLSDEEIGEALTAAAKLKKWLDSVQEYATNRALQGGAIKGWKVVEGRSVRKYSDELAVEKRLEDAGYQRAVITETRILGLSAMEKTIGKKKFEELCGDLIIKPQGKPTLVPESDKRPAMDKTQEAAEDFKEEN